MGVTINDVAARAQVSKSTVSKYLTGRPYVSEATSARVKAAIRELDFEPSALAQGLVTKRTGVVGVVVASIVNPFYTELVQGINEVGSGAGLSVVLATTEGNPKREREALRTLRRKGVDGLIVASVERDDPELDALRRDAVPFVLASRQTRNDATNYVGVDNLGGARTAIDHLLELGHTRIAHVAGRSCVVGLAERRMGYEEGLRVAGIPADDSLIVPETEGFDGGRQALAVLLSLPMASWPTAIFAANDLIALGVLEEARSRGLAVPGALSVVGFDNVFFAGISWVPLTTLDAQPRELGRLSMTMLNALLENPGRDPEQRVLEPTLLRRASTGPRGG
jgi:DNA-binding LacI/PurR family transcriptional regulator